MIQKLVKDLSAVDYYMVHLSIVHNFFPERLTEKEMEVLAHFMSFEGDLVEADRFGTQSRKVVMERMNIKMGGLGNYLKFLRDKKYIYESGGKIHINPYVRAERDGQEYRFVLKRKQ